jgi:hypothetical protein
VIEYPPIEPGDYEAWKTPEMQDILRAKAGVPKSVNLPADVEALQAQMAGLQAEVARLRGIVTAWQEAGAVIAQGGS